MQILPEKKKKTTPKILKCNSLGWSFWSFAHFVQITWQSILAREVSWFWQLTVSKKLSVTFVNFSVCGYKMNLFFSSKVPAVWGPHRASDRIIFIKAAATNITFTVSNVILKSKHLQVSDTVTSIAIRSDNDKLSNLMGLCCFPLIFCFFRICDSFMEMHYSLGNVRSAQPFQWKIVFTSSISSKKELQTDWAIFFPVSV